MDSSPILRIISFGWDKGFPVDYLAGLRVDGIYKSIIFDLRYLPNPWAEDAFKSKTGLTAEVRNWCMEKVKFHNAWTEIVQNTNLWIADSRSVALFFGCMKGRHRSVAMVEEIAQWAVVGTRAKVEVIHRELPQHK